MTSTPTAITDQELEAAAERLAEAARDLSLLGRVRARLRGQEGLEAVEPDELASLASIRDAIDALLEATDTSTTSTESEAPR